MTNISKLALATAAVFAFGASANAADAVMPLPPTPVTPIAPIASYDWSGFYAGVNLGYSMGEFVDNGGAVIGGFDEVDGTIGGAQVGVNAQFDMFVLGAEADLQASDVFERGTDVTVALNHFGTVRARAGLALDAFMPYITGGLAYGESTVYSGGDTFDTESSFGYTVGAGLEAAVTDSISVRGEYLYTDLGNQNYTLSPVAGGGSVDGGMQFHTVRAGVNFHF